MQPTRPIAVANFTDEEGARFGVACLGSRLATGAITPDAALALRDDTGTSLAEAMAAQGRDPRAAGPSAWLDEVGAYVELHVEQGRWLAPAEAAVGVATAIWPHGRYRFDFCGQGNHAGATAMADRRDPMLAYAATVLAARELASGPLEGSGPSQDVNDGDSPRGSAARPAFVDDGDSPRRSRDARATFGRVQVRPGSTNSIPSRVTAWLDARAESTAELDALVRGIVARAEASAAAEGATVEFRAESTTGAVLAARLPTAMLFVRNPTGVSHAPEESATDEDIEAGVDALTRVIEELA